MSKSTSRRQKRTKIVCTIGPASSSLPILSDMIRAGMNVARINFSHGTHENNAQLVANVRAAAKKVGLPVAILLDLQGPKIRIGELPEHGIELKEGKIVTLMLGEKKTTDGSIPVPYPGLQNKVKVGAHILLDDGTKEVKVTKLENSTLKAKVLLGGTLLSRKGITIPGISLVNDAITEKDEADLQFGLQHAMDFVAMSFVRQAQDVQKLKKKIKKYLPKDASHPAIIAKIEKQEALENFDEILHEVDAIMIARGDLGLETPISQVPVHQKMIIKKSLAADKPMITATEMLGSMQFNPRPTRAEVSDVANAVFDGSDAVMLSGETAMGKYPGRVVEMMAQIIQNTETALLENNYQARHSSGHNPLTTITQAAITLAHNLDAAAIAVITHNGNCARIISSLRPKLPIFAFTDNHATFQQLLLNWGVTPIYLNLLHDPAATLTAIRTSLRVKKYVHAGKQCTLVSDLQPEINSIQVVQV